jgi:hypothetical protein
MIDGIHTDGRPVRSAFAEDIVELEQAREEKRRRLAEANPIKSFAAGPLLADIAAIAPREWLLGTVFCRQFVSSLIGSGGGGKTAIRYAQYLALATGRPLTGEHVHKRGRILLLCFEDDLNEMRRRFAALMLQHGVAAHEIGDWLHFAPMPTDVTLLHSERGVRAPGLLLQALRIKIEELQPDLVAIDPFARVHGLESENDNAGMAAALGMLTKLAAECNIAIDLCHHANKGPTEAGDAGRSRGASANIDAQRLARTLTPMTCEEAARFGVPEGERRAYVRIDDGKVNLAPAGKATWFRLVGVKLGNGTADYPNGDEVQAAVRWRPPDIWDGPLASFADIFDEIDAGFDGRRYSASNASKDRGGYKVVQRHLDRTDAQARQIINNWVRDGVLRVEEYLDPKRREKLSGLFGNLAKRPG